MNKRIISFVLSIMIILTVPVAVFADTNTNYIRNNAAWYAYNYYYYPNTADYYLAINPDRSANDCTNFVSQCLAYGGMAMKNYGGSYSSLSSWYGGSGGGSATWENADNFRKHWANINGTGLNRGY